VGDTGTVAIRDLEEILTHLSAHQRPGRWCMISGVALPDTVVPAATIIEDEGTTSVVTVAQAQGLGVEPDFVAAWLTLDVNSALEAVGLTAAVAEALATEGIACNVLAGYYHDHLLVPAAQAERSLSILNALGRSHKS